MNNKGLFYGRNNNNDEGVKCFGIENMWGNKLCFIAGFGNKNNSYNIKICSPYDSVNNNGYTNIVIDSMMYNILPSTPIAIKYNSYLNGAIILPTLTQTDATKGWCDEVEGIYSTESSNIHSIVVGGWYESDLENGPFNFSAFMFRDHRYENVCSRLLISR